MQSRDGHEPDYGSDRMRIQLYFSDSNSHSKSNLDSDLNFQENRTDLNFRESGAESSYNFLLCSNSKNFELTPDPIRSELSSDTKGHRYTVKTNYPSLYWLLTAKPKHIL